MNSFSTLFNRSEKVTQPRFMTDLRPHFPSVDELLAKAEKTTQSCRLSEQIDVSRLFYKDVAIRGLNSRRYSIEEAKRVGIIVDYLAETRRRQLAPADAV
ncbi:MAG: hypothetical protein RI932_1010 [Pseudomonadota bacterium]|jgi:hypothetical protein